MSRPPGIRTCIVCKKKRPKTELLRLVLNWDGSVVMDLKGNMMGRGAYVCRDIRCLKKLRKFDKSRYYKVFKRKVSGVTIDFETLFEENINR